jgi:hypothetical protein
MVGDSELPPLLFPLEGQTVSPKEWMSCVKLILRYLKRDLLALGLSPGAWKRYDLDGLMSAPEKVPGATIAVVGRQGIGKSSLLNAILDDDILPTGSLNWCTGVPTKIKYHAESTYRAKIKTIEPTEWLKEIEKAKASLSSEDDNEGSERSDNSHTETSLNAALERVRAVYPGYCAEGRR